MYVICGAIYATSNAYESSLARTERQHVPENCMHSPWHIRACACTQLRISHLCENDALLEEISKHLKTCRHALVMHHLSVCVPWVCLECHMQAIHKCACVLIKSSGNHLAQRYACLIDHLGVVKINPQIQDAALQDTWSANHRTNACLLRQLITPLYKPKNPD